MNRQSTLYRLWYLATVLSVIAGFVLCFLILWEML
jgi:hypothetical protein